jgi:NAD(P)-dependent dehydrogenase (short-subunit alcohol dehydrogenase family)
MRLKDKIVLVTGSTTGIGEATARLCVAEGARVMVHGRNEERAQALCAELGDAAAYVLADLAEADAGPQIVQATLARFGTLDVVVNNAAVTTRGNLDNTDTALFDWIMAINLRSPMFTIQAAVKEFRRKGGGVILNVGSINALAGEPNLLAYSSAKGGLETMSRNLANALASEKIRVNHLNVGWTTSNNEIALKQTEGMRPGWETRVPQEYAPFGRLFTPEQVAQHIVFWISDDSYPANGCVYELEQYSIIGRNVSKAFD